MTRADLDAVEKLLGQLAAETPLADQHRVQALYQAGSAVDELRAARPVVEHYRQLCAELAYVPSAALSTYDSTYDKAVR